MRNARFSRAARRPAVTYHCMASADVPSAVPPARSPTHVYRDPSLQSILGRRYGRPCSKRARTRLKSWSFTVGHQRFGVNVAKVREVRTPGTVTRLPRYPEAVHGVIRVRERGRSPDRPGKAPVGRRYAGRGGRAGERPVPRVQQPHGGLPRPRDRTHLPRVVEGSNAAARVSGAWSARLPGSSCSTARWSRSWTSSRSARCWVSTATYIRSSIRRPRAAGTARNARSSSPTTRRCCVG